MSRLLDRVPRPVRDLAVGGLCASLLVVVQVVLAKSGVTGVEDWSAIGRAALDAGAVAVAAGLNVGLLAWTRANGQYGRGKHVATDEVPPQG